ncbi:hypothetical protein HQ945_08350 [Phyllobacterium sp. BT25]|uniref:Uncharacterized protein n=1 Tax=Phyllobacterium pellucidum TaxID=2740464 RepID=A0A849VQH4_9HYPH|nr:hypothetical protein [Phyllobacterium pellucidum]NTS31264.1 hypothetical protein [Phyllobacterium pellucidum]
MAEKKINKRVFKTEPMLATNAIILQARLAKVLGPAIDRIGEIFAGRGENASEEAKAKSNAAAIAAFSDIFSKSDPRETANLVKDIVEVAMIARPNGNYENVDFDNDFTGELGDVMPVVIFVLREQFGDFFSALLASGVRK